MNHRIIITILILTVALFGCGKEEVEQTNIGGQTINTGSLTIDSFDTAGFVKNDANGLLSGGNISAGGGAPVTADYLVGTANGDLSAEIVVGVTPQGELGGTWGSPTIDTIHSGSAHHAAVTLAGTPDYLTLSSQQITLTVLDISDDTNLTAGDALTLNDDDIDFDGGAAPLGELGGVDWANPTVDATHSGSTHHDAVTVTDSVTVDLTLSGQDVTADSLLTFGDALTLNTADVDFDGGASPGGELGGADWSSPTVDTTHSGSAHHVASGYAEFTSVGDNQQNVSTTPFLFAQGIYASTTVLLTDTTIFGNSTTTGEMVVDGGKNIGDYLATYNGSFLQHFNATSTSDGSQVRVNLESSLDYNSVLTARFSSGDVSFPAPTSTDLQAGSDVSPQANYVYVTEASQFLEVSTTNWPATEHIKVAYFLVPSATHVQSEGSYINQNWNDGAIEGNMQGHFTTISERIRADGAYYFSGVDPNGDASTYLVITAGNVELKSTAGIVYQMHKHTVPAFDTSASDDVHVVNWNGTAYNSITNLHDIIADADGDSLNNKWANLVVWRTANKGGEYEPMFINLPTCGYNVQASAEGDIDGCDVYSIPREFHLDSSTGFLITRITVRIVTAGTWSYGSAIDLRGISDVQAATGGATGVATDFADNQFTVFDDGDITKIMAFDVGTNLTTGNTRTYIAPDSDGTMSLLEATQTFTGQNIFSDVTRMTELNATTTGIDILNVWTTASTSALVIGDGNIDMKSNSITNYFSPACSAGDFINDISDAGVFSCDTPAGGGAGYAEFVQVGDNQQNVSTTPFLFAQGLLASTTVQLDDTLIHDNATVTDHFAADATFYVNDSKVGVGITIPDSLFTVNGNISMRNSGSFFIAGSGDPNTYLRKNSGNVEIRNGTDAYTELKQWNGAADISLQLADTELFELFNGSSNIFTVGNSGSATSADSIFITNHLKIATTTHFADKALVVEGDSYLSGRATVTDEFTIGTSSGFLFIPASSNGGNTSTIKSF